MLPTSKSPPFPFIKIQIIKIERFFNTNIIPLLQTVYMYTYTPIYTVLYLHNFAFTRGLKKSSADIFNFNRLVKLAHILAAFQNVSIQSLYAVLLWNITYVDMQSYQTLHQL